MTILRNAIKCNNCGDTIESTHTHDFKWCSCGLIAVDGGLFYLKRCYKSSNENYKRYTELSKTDAKEEDYDTD